MNTYKSAILTVATLTAVSAFAAPPAPAVPTGACAGMITKNSLVTHPYSDPEVQNEEYLGVPHATMYMDFDNGLAYMDGILETGAVLTNEEDRSTFELFSEMDGGALTVSVSDTYTYALDVNISYTLDDEAQELPLLFVPTNGGTTFFVMETGGMYKGVCQQI